MQVGNVIEGISKKTKHQYKLRCVQLRDKSDNQIQLKLWGNHSENADLKLNQDYMFHCVEVNKDTTDDTIELHSTDLTSFEEVTEETVEEETSTKQIQIIEMDG